MGGFSKPFNMLSLDAQKTKFATNVPACLREATLRIVTVFNLCRIILQK